MLKDKISEPNKENGSVINSDDIFVSETGTALHMPVSFGPNGEIILGDLSIEAAPLPSSDDIFSDKFVSVEFVVKFHCPLIENDGVFYTDSNGLDMIERKRNNSGKVNKNYNPIGENYYPVTTAIVIRSTVEEQTI